jgi:cysteinyl-tRNA synthetase
MEALEDDLNTPGAISELHRLYQEKRFGELLFGLNLLGLSGKREAIARTNSATGLKSGAALAGGTAAVTERIAARIAARKAKNWAEADRIRDELVAMGIVIMDAKNPKTGEIETTWEIAR